MKRQMTKAEARAWMDRWKIVNDFEREELRRTPIETKVRQLAAMMAMALRLDWHTSTDAELRLIRERWVRLKKVMRATR